MSVTPPRLAQLLRRPLSVSAGLAIAVAGLVFLQLMIEGPLAFQGIAGMDNRWRLGLLAALMTMAGLSTLAAITVCAIWGYFYNNSAGDPLVQVMVLSHHYWDSSLCST